MKNNCPQKNLCYSARKKTGLNQRRFGELIGRSQNRVSEWESGHHHIEEYTKCILTQIRRSCTKTSSRLLPWLLSEGRIGDALVVALGGKLKGELGEFVQAAENLQASAGVLGTEAGGSSPELAS